MHIHITLVGGQNIPIYLGIYEKSPDVVVFVCTDKTREQSELIGSIVKLKSEYVIVNPLDYQDIKLKLVQLFENYKENRISFNLTGGTKLMSLAAFSYKDTWEHVDFDYIDQNYQLFNLNTNTSRVLTSTIDLDTYFKLSGNHIKSYKKLEQYPRQILESWIQVRELIHFSPGEYYNLTGTLANKNNQFQLTTKAGSSYDYDHEKDEVRIHLVNKTRTITRVLAFRQANDILLNTIWFELEVAQIFSKWKFTREIYHSVVVPYNSGSDKNEIDLVISLGQKWLFVECKTQVNDIKDIDKFRNVVKNYGGLGAKSILITDAPINDRVIEKCKDNNILTFSLKQAKNNSMFMVDQSLFLMLESELFTSNPI